MRAVGRRAWLAGAAGTLALLRAPGRAAGREPGLGGDPFTLGVAAGAPRPDGLVLWTRLAPAPLGDGGMPPRPVPVTWEVAADEGMQRVLRRGETTARPEWAHAVHVEVGGLAPDRWHWYRFRAGGAASPVGRARTAPAPGAPLGSFRLAYASCQHWEQGYYGAYRDLVRGEPDLVVHLGDYIYEVPSWTGPTVRRHDGPEPTTLEGYRRRHALYRTDPDLRAAHAACAWVFTWDDHEVDNDYAGDRSQDGDDPERFRRRRAAAYQAYWEHMPLPRAARPRGAAMRLHQRLGFGELLDLFVLDTRQHRDPQPCGDGRRAGGRLVEGCAERLEPGRGLLGAEQERWLLDGLARPGARWTAVAQPQLMAELRRRTRGGGLAHWTDGWDGYPAARARLLGRLHERRVPNPVVLGGDIHSFWVTDLRTDPGAEGAPVVATEIVGTSISSAGVPHDTFAAYLPDNPHVRFFDSRQRGYVRCTVTPERWRADLRVVADVRDPGTAASTLASFVIEAGRPGAQRA
jgi:alkaline phosphatase D